MQYFGFQATIPSLRRKPLALGNYQKSFIFVLQNKFNTILNGKAKTTVWDLACIGR
jgi:hypothetical protein